MSVAAAAPGRLYLLPVPLHGADDAVLGLPEATLAVARRLEHFLVEDAKSARAALKAIGHPGPIARLSMSEIGHQPLAARHDEWLAPVLAGHDAAIISEAGCPAVADPGASLVARAHQRGIRVVPLIGPSAILLALMASGGNGQSFRFAGYLPQAADARSAGIRALEARVRGGETQIVIETPYRNDRLLDALLAALHDAVVLTVAVALTSPDELVASGTIASWRTGRVVRPHMQRRPAVFVLAAASAIELTTDQDTA